MPPDIKTRTPKSGSGSGEGGARRGGAARGASGWRIEESGQPHGCTEKVFRGHDEEVRNNGCTPTARRVSDPTNPILVHEQTVKRAEQADRQEQAEKELGRD